MSVSSENREVDTFHKKYITSPFEGILSITTLLNPSKDNFVTLEQHTGSRKLGTPGTLSLTRYNVDLQLEKKREICRLSGFREAEVYSALAHVGQLMILVISSSQFDETINYVRKSSIGHKNGFYCFVLNWDLDILDDFSFLDCDSNSFEISTSENDIFITGSALQPKTHLISASLRLQTSFHSLNTIYGAFLVKLHMVHTDGTLKIDFKWSRVFSEYVEAPLPDALANIPVGSSIEDHSLSLRSEASLSSKDSRFIAKSSDSTNIPQVMISGIDVGELSDTKIVLVGQYTGSVVCEGEGDYISTSQSDPLVNPSMVRSWMAILDDNGLLMGIWDLTPVAASDSSVLASDIVRKNDIIYIAGRADGVVTFERPQMFTDVLPDMLLPGKERGGFLTALSPPDSSSEPIIHTWTRTFNYILSSRLRIKENALELTGFFWNTLKIKSDSLLLLVNGSGHLDRFSLEVSYGGELRGHRLIQAAHMQRSEAIAHRDGITVVVSSKKPFTQFIGVVSVLSE